MPGWFLALEGPDGAGKSTLATRLATWLEGRGLVARHVREPGGTALGEAVRRLLLDPDAGELTARAELLLFLASRAQLAAEVLLPALARGEVVIADRFHASTAVYQGFAGGILPMEEVLRLSLDATSGLRPDLTILLDIPADVAEARRARGAARDRIERRPRAYLERVCEGYRAYAAHAPEDVRTIDATRDPDEVLREVVLCAERALAARGLLERERHDARA